MDAQDRRPPAVFRLRPGAGLPALLAVAAVLATARVAPAAIAGWSDDPAANTLLSGRPGEQALPKIQPLADGGAYVSWYDNAGGGYDPTLQRIDARGEVLWAKDGIALADTAFSWVTDYDLAADADGSALLAFRDDRSGSEQVTAVRIDPDGKPLWGPSGKTLSAASEFVGPPRLCSTSDDRVVVGWTEGSLIRIQRLGLDGSPLWSSAVEISDAKAQLMLADIEAAPEGGFIVSWVRSAGFTSPRQLFTQRFSAEGEALWGEADAAGSRQPLPVFGKGTLQYGNFPPFIPDGEGGAVFVWYETDPLQPRAQRVDAAGRLLWGPDGLPAAAPDPSVDRVEPAGAFDPRTGDVTVFWRETPRESGPYRQALRGQRIDRAGQRAWGEAGRELAAWGPHELTQLEAAAVPDGVLLAWVEKLAEGDQRVWIRKLAADGTDRWAPQLAVSSAAGAKSRLTLALLHGGTAALAWQDTRGGSEDIYLQNVNADGSLGKAAAPTPPPPTATAEEPTTEPSSSPRPPATPTEGGRRLYLPLLRSAN